MESQMVELGKCPLCENLTIHGFCQKSKIRD